MLPHDVESYRPSRDYEISILEQNAICGASYIKTSVLFNITFQSKREPVDTNSLLLNLISVIPK